VLRLETVVIIVAPKFQDGSVLPYADSSFEQGVAGWTVAAGVATLARTTPWGDSSYDGAYALTISSSTASASTIRSAKFPVTAGVNWRALVHVHPDAGTWTSVLVRIRWYDAANADLGPSTGTAYSVPGSSWYAMSTDDEAPAAATQGAVELVVTAAATSSVLHVDAVSLWQVLPLTEVAADSDAGFATLTMRELPLDLLLSVFRVAPDGSRTLVRGAGGLLDRAAITSDILRIEDHEAPFGVLFYYRIEIHDTGGNLEATRTSDTVQLVLADVNEAWLKDPSMPQRNLRVLVKAAPDWSEPIEQAVQRVRGRRNAVIFSDVRGGPEGDLAVWTRSDEERKALDLLLSSGNTLLWQVAPGMGEDDMYVKVGQLGRARVSPLAQEAWREWTLPLVEQDMPVTIGVNGSGGRTWQDVITEFATCADLLPVYGTCEDLLLDRRG
jgi:hypothetical protein